MSVVASSVVVMEKPLVDTDSPSGVLVGLRAHRVAADAHEVAILVTAAQWADLHPTESINDAACLAGTEGEVATAGEGAPLVVEFACAELAVALGVPTEWGARLMGDSLELRHRLPRVWARMTGGQLPAWRARRIAQATRGLSRAAAAWVDAQVAPFAHKIGPAQTDRLVAAAMARFDPEAAEAERARAADGRCFEVDHRQVSFAGTSRVYGELDLADALDLEAAVAAGADQLARLGSTDGLDVRRAVAVGELARRQGALDLAVEDSDSPPTRPASKRRTTRTVVLYVHLSDAAITGADPVARVENAGGARLVTANQVRDWCGDPDARVLVKPVIDLAEQISVDAYEVADRVAEPVRLTFPTCVFPWCTRPARSCDLDHGTPYAACRRTCSVDLAPLCRRHHRLKTHGGWIFTRLDETSVLWRSPHGLSILRDHTGTTDVTAHQPVDPPEQ